MKKKKVDALLFDLDGTLIDSRRDIVEASQVVLDHFGREKLSPEVILSYVGEGLPELIKKILDDPKEETHREGIEIFRHYYRDHCTVYTCLFEGVRDTLEHFREKPLALISNKPEDFSRQIVNHFELADYFSCILGGDSLPKRKPHALPIHTALKQFGVSPEKAVMIGDSLPDLEAGRSAGVMTCGVTYGLRTREQLVPADPDYFIDHLTEIMDIFF